MSILFFKKLAQIFYRLKIIEAFGTGIPRIFSAYEQSPVKPKIPVVDGGFLIRLPNQNYGLHKAKGNANNRELKLLEEFSEVEFTKEDAAETLGISASGAYKLLVRMNEKGLLAARKDNKQWRYSVIKNER